MLKLIFFGIGFTLVFEGLVFFFFSKKVTKFYKMIQSFDTKYIRHISMLFIISGLCVIYFDLKFYGI